MAQSESPTRTVRSALTSIPESITCTEDYELIAREFIEPSIYAHIAGGSGRETTLKSNLEAYQNVRLMNRVLVDFTTATTRTRILNQEFRHPLLLGPVAFQKLVHPDGELASARAADALESGMISSTLSSYSLEEIATETSGHKWFQLYFQPGKADTLDLVRRAERSGYDTLVVTLDVPVRSGNRRAQAAGFVMPAHVQAVNLKHHSIPPQVSLNPDQSVIFQGIMSEAPTWSDLQWLIEETTLPVVVKGILNPMDACQAIACGASGVIVSNHGGRALDGVPSTLESLPAIREALGDGVAVLLDGGIRSGSDVFKAIALGADAVLIGRLPIYALAVAGAIGVAHLLRLFRDELELCMALTGCTTLEEINESCLIEGSAHVARR
ncbi:alpha-hydroxy-acid oxidizing protein [Ketobacter sp. MCCC 1A13808]|uniref:alpha-hydroxy acid oxidase n=1 Tax=Ketobacter sp. MCCC 1A13808 TaxID=2602738 RepID=UPI0012EB8748|nr:alpha-hydroxy acid oxidase [Ketobacter sp. MCCC 1A13808]MVF14728.1 alpha-hydroxy-acid oxidizing protein [Ketobacter sp. MCCC 1A13808]